MLGCAIAGACDTGAAKTGVAGSGGIDRILSAHAPGHRMSLIVCKKPVESRYILRMWRLLTRLLQLPLALLLVFYEWGWQSLAHVFDFLAQMPLWRVMEDGIRRLPPWAALVLFALPTLTLLPVKLAALWLIAQGHEIAGVVVILTAKIVGTAVVARLFLLTQQALLRLRWFAAFYRWFVPWKDLWINAIRASWPWRVGRVMKFRAKRAVLAAYRRIFPLR